MSIQHITLQFNVSSRCFIPDEIREVNYTPLSMIKSKGEIFINSTEWCTAPNLLDDLEKAGFTLVDAFIQRRMNKGRGGNHFVIRFILTKHRTKEMQPHRKNSARRAYLQLCETAIWKIRAYNNPYQNMPGERSISVNFNSRQATTQADGSPVMVWPQDKDGLKNRSRAKIPLRPDYTLGVVNQVIEVVPAQQEQMATS